MKFTFTLFLLIAVWIFSGTRLIKWLMKRHWPEWVRCLTAGVLAGIIAYFPISLVETLFRLSFNALDMAVLIALLCAFHVWQEPPIRWGVWLLLLLPPLFIGSYAVLF